MILLSAIKSGSALKFAISRFSRIYPTYWFALAVSALVYFVYGNPGRHITIPQTLINTTMLQRFLRVDNVDQVYWTLAVELQFYVMVALYLILRRGKIYRRELTTILLTWSVIGTALCLLFHPENSLGGAPKMIVWSLLRSTPRSLAWAWCSLCTAMIESSPGISHSSRFWLPSTQR